MNFDGDQPATRILHELTSYEPGLEWFDAKDDPRLVQDFEPNDVDRRPLFAKRYGSELPRTALPRELPVTSLPTLEVLAGTARPEAAPLDLAGLARVLYLSAGVVRTTKTKSGEHLFRAAGSAGGRFPLELYVAVPDAAPGERDGDGGDGDVPPGVHWYDPVEHALVQVGPAPRAETQPQAPTQAPTIIVTGVPWRTGWRYRERGFRHVYWDAGTMLSQLLTLADSAGLAPRLYTGFPDADVSGLVGADQTHEWPVALVSLGSGAPAIHAGGPAATGEVDKTIPLEFPLVTAAQRAGDGDVLAEPWDLAGPPAGSAEPKDPAGPADVLHQDSPTLDEVIVKRGSQRRMDASRGLPLETLRTCMTLALRGIDVDHWVAVHDVTGLAPGIYRWPELERPVRAAADQTEMRTELHEVCLGQVLGRDAAFVVIATTDVSRLSGREYRERQLAAGLVEGRLHLAAYALGAGATGMTFVDSEIPALLSEQPPIDALIFTCVGVPANTSKPAGAPGTPTEIRMVSTQ
jgi:SagB-type dehydrogenase family enzyme